MLHQQWSRGRSPDRGKRVIIHKQTLSFVTLITLPFPTMSIQRPQKRSFSRGIAKLHIDRDINCKQPLVELLSLPPAGIGGAASWQLVPAGSCSPPPSPAKPSSPASYPAPAALLPRLASCPDTPSPHSHAQWPVDRWASTSSRSRHFSNSFLPIRKSWNG